mgnify:FL=1
MKILVINAGSSSLKYQLIDMENENVIAKGICEKIGIEDSKITQKSDKGEISYNKYMPNHKVAMELVLSALTDENKGVIKSVDEIDAVGHRVLHAKDDFKESVLANDETLAICDKNTEFGPLHMAANIGCVRSCMEIMPKTPMGLVFDTQFHSTMPAKAYMYGIKYEDYEKYGVRKYGFHGTSHKYVSSVANEFLGKEHSKIVTCHLGNGSSISAVVDGKCVDTTMGFTPLEGMIMGTRCGNIDAAAVEFLGKKLGKSSAEMVTYLNKECGLQGVGGVIGGDCRDLHKKMNEGDSHAVLAFDMLCYHIKKHIGSFAAAMGGLDMIVFTGGIGEHDEDIRRIATENLEFMGVELDEEKNDAKLDKDVNVISKDGSKVVVAVIPTNEELVIARETANLIK